MKIPEWFKGLVIGGGDVAAVLASAFIGRKLADGQPIFSKASFKEGSLGAKCAELSEAAKKHFVIERHKVLDVLVPLGANSAWIIALLKEAVKGPVKALGHHYTEHWITSMLLEVSSDDPDRREEIYTDLNGMLAASDRDQFFTILEGYSNNGLLQQWALFQEAHEDEIHAVNVQLARWNRSLGRVRRRLDREIKELDRKYENPGWLGRLGKRIDSAITLICGI